MARRLLTRALVAALVAAAMFALKAVSIASGRDPFADPLVNLFFFLGIAALLVTFALTGAALARRPGPRGRLLAAAVGLAVGVVGSALVAVVATTVLPSTGSWVWGEVNLWVIALLALATVLVLRARPDVRLRTV